MNENSLPPSDRSDAPDTQHATRNTSRPVFACDEQLRSQLLTFRDAEGSQWSNATIAAEIGRSPRVIADYLNPDGNKYNGDIVATERRIREFLRNHRLAFDSQVESIDCEIARQIADAIEDIRTARRIGVIIGEPGIGKSRGAGLYCSAHELAIYFSVWEGECSKTAVVDLLFKAADVGHIKKGENKIVKLAQKLDGAGRVIIPDDAHKLSPHALQLLYDFRDRAGTPIALLGDERLLAKLESDKQRLRRTGVVTRLKIRNPEPIIAHHVDRFAPDAGDERRDLIALCQELAVQRIQGEGKPRYLPKEGVFGSVQMELSLAARIKQAKPDLSWCEAIKKAHARLIRKLPLN